MKRRDLERRLRIAGCFLQEGRRQTFSLGESQKRDHGSYSKTYGDQGTFSQENPQETGRRMKPPNKAHTLAGGIAPRFHVLHRWPARQ
jgi:hypothetical protein